MSTRLILNGREAFATGVRRQDDRVVRGRKRDRMLDNVMEPPPPGNLPARVGELADQDEDVTYRIVAKLDPKQGWCLAQQLLEHYGVSYRALLDWCRRGLVDPAMQLGSPTKRYRVRDDGACRALADEWKAEQALRAVRKKAVSEARVQLKERKARRSAWVDEAVEIAYGKR